MTIGGRNLLIFCVFVGVVMFFVTYSAMGEGLNHGSFSLFVGLLAAGATYLLSKAFLNRS